MANDQHLINVWILSATKSRARTRGRNYGSLWCTHIGMAFKAFSIRPRPTVLQGRLTQLVQSQGPTVFVSLKTGRNQMNTISLDYFHLYTNAVVKCNLRNFS